MRLYLEDLIGNPNQNALLISKSQLGEQPNILGMWKIVHMVEDTWIVIVLGLFLWTYKWKLSLFSYLYIYLSWSFAIVQSLSCVQLFETPWTATCQASLSFTISWSLVKLMSIESVMLFNHLILCCPLVQSFPTSGIFIWLDSLHQVAKVLELQHQSFQRIFRIDFL